MSVDPDEGRLRVLLEGSRDGPHSLSYISSAEDLQRELKVQTHERVVASKGDRELALARVGVDTLSELLGDL